MKKIELEEGQIWLIPKTLDVRVINLWKFGSQSLSYNDIGGNLFVCRRDSFLRWVHRNKAILTGEYDFDKRKATFIEEGTGTCPTSGGEC